jgi:hypothetical protein
MIADSALTAIGGLAAIVLLLFLLITRYNWHVFLALLVPILLFALLPGVDGRAVIAAFEQGFGTPGKASRRSTISRFSTSCAPVTVAAWPGRRTAAPRYRSGSSSKVRNASSGR